MRKFFLLACSGVLTLGLAGAMPTLTPGPADDPPPPDQKKGEAAKKGEPGPEGDLHRAYDLLRRIKTDDGVGGRADERLRGWTDRAASLYRRGVQAFADGDHRRAHEYGVAAHDLARAVDHARNAARLDHADPDLPLPPPGAGPAGDAAQARRDLRHAYDRIEELAADPDKESKYYLDGARDLYTAARRDAEDGRNERAAELARAAEALTHVPEHLNHAAEAAPEPPPEPKPKAKAKKKGDGPEPKVKKDARPQADDELPPPLTPRH